MKSKQELQDFYRYQVKRIIAKLVAENLTQANFSRKAALTILSKTDSDVFWSRLFLENEQAIFSRLS